MSDGLPTTAATVTKGLTSRHFGSESAPGVGVGDYGIAPDRDTTDGISVIQRAPAFGSSECVRICGLLVLS
jgi:hypothetical protein